MREERVRFPGGGISLEGVRCYPEGNGPFPAVIVCHPHPLYGGSMDNNVVDSLCAALAGVGLGYLKFNFRGVGGSGGAYTGGEGETADVRAALDFLAEHGEVPAGLAGYSAGAAYALPAAVGDPRVSAFAAVSPPLGMADFTPLRDCPKPVLLIAGGHDDFVPRESFRELCAGLPGTAECRVIEDADHFWVGQENVLAPLVAAFFRKNIRDC
ncbi:MAG: alpha/beta hydrolase [Chloroflexota bacterium]